MKRPWIKGALRIGAAAVTAWQAAKRARSAAQSVRRAVPRTRTRFSMKRRYGSRTITRRKRKSSYQFGNPNQYIRQTHSRGKRLRKNIRGAWKVIKSNTEGNIQGLRQYSAFGGTGGVLVLKNISPSPSTGPIEVPLHLYELNASLNDVGGVVTQPTIGWYPSFSNPGITGTLSWSNTFNLVPENTTGSASTYQNGAGKRDMLDWVQAKMLFYAPTTRAARIQVDLVQFTDTRLVPDATTTSAFATAVYQALVKRFTISPLETGNNEYSKYLKILDSKTFIMDAKESTDPVNTNMREVNLFYRMNRLCRYDWAEDDAMGLLSLNDTQINQGDVSTQVHPRARIFLMIRGQSTNAAAYSATIHPSYDLVIRTKHSALSR